MVKIMITGVIKGKRPSLGKRLISCNQGKRLIRGVIKGKKPSLGKRLIRGVIRVKTDEGCNQGQNTVTG